MSDPGAERNDLEEPRRRPRPPPNRRRDKPTLSCGLCRRRKLRCDRQLPCGTCKSKGLDAQCSFTSGARPSPLTLSPRSSRTNSPRPAVSVHERLHQLEELVVDMMKYGALPESRQDPGPLQNVITPASSAEITDAANLSDIGTEESPPPPGFGSLKVSDSRSNYVDSTHWSTVLDGISELRDEHLAMDRAATVGPLPEPSQSSPGSGEPILLYGCYSRATKEELLASLPDRTKVDRLISSYFNGLDMSSCVLHSGEFLNQYKLFWENPQSVPVMWLGLLFGMMCISQQFLAMSHPNSPEFAQAADLYRERVVQCLILGEYTKGGDLAIETLVHYIIIEYMLRKSVTNGIYILLGIIINIATTMGYHRDPRNFPLSAYATEMRRRLWATLYHMDLGMSAEIGMPRHMKNAHIDVVEPRNLFDSDFNKDTVELPPSRPETELTPMLYARAKIRLCRVVAEISDTVTDTGRVSYKEVMKIDAKLEEARAKNPKCFRWTSIADSVTLPTNTVCTRLYLELIYHKARIILYRRYLGPPMNRDQYAYSRRVAIGAVKKVLQYHHLVDEELQPSGRFHMLRWKFQTLVNNDFLLATFTGCYYLHYNHTAAEDPDVQEVESLLRKSQGIWIRNSRMSECAAKAADALRIVLRKLDNRRAELQNCLGNLGPTIDPITMESDLMDREFLTAVNFQMPFYFFNPLFDGNPMSTQSAGTDDLCITPFDALDSNN